MYHYRKTWKRYLQSRNTDGCPFCRAQTLKDAVFETKLSYVVPNIVKYDLWEAHDVTDHLLLVPKRHVLSLNDLNKEEKLDIIEIAASYEVQGYNVYARGKAFSKRSVAHQHTHLIKAKNQKPKWLFFIAKPRLLIKR